MIDMIRIRPLAGGGAHEGEASWQQDGKTIICRCALGQAGMTTEKREGDMATPMGRFKLRALYYRPDQFPTPPETGLDCIAIAQEDGWCDDPAKQDDYNKPVSHPYDGSAEHLWREDRLYDLMVPLGYNDDPAVPGRGSAIFMHLAKPDYAHTEGCVALSRDDLLSLLALCGPNTEIDVCV